MSNAYTITDCSFRVLFARQLEINESEISTENLSTGIYHIKIGSYRILLNHQ